MKYIFVIGGVLSGIGKGISAASIGTLLTKSGYKVSMQKLDGYLNVDPGTMSPFEHGEVFVTDDGAETDLDLGHYERFIDASLNKHCSYSAGALYQEMIERERNGKYLGKTVQIIPHLTDLVKEEITTAAQTAQCDVMIVEIGGTVGDMENEFYVEAARQMRSELGSDNVQFVHVTLLPYIAASKELKTKPTQASIRDLRSRGIQADFIILRADHEIPQEICSKVANFCDVQVENVIPAPTRNSIYSVPLEFDQTEILLQIQKRLCIPTTPAQMDDWKQLANNMQDAKEKLTVALVGKYNGLEDAYFSVVEGIKSAIYAQGYIPDIKWVDAEDIEKQGAEKLLSDISGILVPGGFGDRGIEGKILTAQYARENKIPYFGICLGSQIMALEFARNVLGLDAANSEEFAPTCENKIVHFMEDQKTIRAKGGTMRLGAYDCNIQEGTLAYEAYGVSDISERHRHRYEFNNMYR
ncbi:MAG: CTP synthase, partial [Patescibacteria group bacterium]|nr:CTP synthase [Patescibacteria group bacterium]